MPVRGVHEVWQGSEVAVHAEQAVGDDQAAPVLAFGIEKAVEVVDIPVAIDEGLCPGEPAGVDDAAMVETVAENRVFRADEGTHRAQVRHVAGGKAQGRFGTQETGHPVFQRPMRFHVS